MPHPTPDEVMQLRADLAEGLTDGAPCISSQALGLEAMCTDALVLERLDAHLLLALASKADLGRTLLALLGERQRLAEAFTQRVVAFRHQNPPDTFEALVARAVQRKQEGLALEEKQEKSERAQEAARAARAGDDSSPRSTDVTLDELIALVDTRETRAGSVAARAPAAR